MDDSRRTRIILMLMAGILLIGGSLLWVNSQRQGQEEVAFQSSTLRKHRHRHRLRGKGAKAARLAAKNGQALNGPGQAALPPGLNLGEKPMPGDKQGALALKGPALSTNQALQNKYLARGPVKARLSGANTFLSPPAVAPGNLPQPLTKLEPAKPFPPGLPQAPEKKEIAPTPLELAQVQAREGAGRNDPFGPVTGYKPFPRFAPPAKDEEEESAGEGEGGPSSLEGHVKGKLEKVSKKQAALVPPPPPAGASLASEGGVSLPIDELPAPPTKPSIADKMQLVSLIGDRAMFTFTDPRAKLTNRWPNWVTLGPGEKFESVSLIGVGSDSATLDEDGERTVKSLEPIR